MLPWTDCMRLKSLRRSLGLRQIDLALKLGISERTVQAIERGELRARRQHLHEILQEFFRRHGQAL